MHSNYLLVLALVMLVVGLAGILVIGPGQPVSPTPSPDPIANGASILFTAADLAGRPTLSGWDDDEMACANCHGVDGRGLYTPMFVSPNITYKNLTDPSGMLEPGGDRGTTYTDEMIKGAITQGLDGEGKRLRWPMPLWMMSDRDLNDLIAFLKTLP